MFLSNATISVKVNVKQFDMVLKYIDTWQRAHFKKILRCIYPVFFVENVLFRTFTWVTKLIMMNWTWAGWHESRYKCGALRIRRHFIDELWEQSAILPEDEWRTLARQRLVDFEDQLHEAFSAGLTSYSGKRTWGFWDAVAFSMTTVATIGAL